jgi:hypothetical protein
MGTFAETAIVDYRHHFPTKDKLFHFRLQQTNGSLPLPFPFLVYSKQMEIVVYR